MAKRAPILDAPVVACRISADVRQKVEEYARALKAAAPEIGGHGLSREEFLESGLFESAVEKLRGERAASMATKRSFIRLVLDHLAANRRIEGWRATGGNDRHDYEVSLPSGRLCAIEAKGCLDGNNTNIFRRPPNADEFILWSLCQNPGADPRHNAWSGIHTRLGAEIIASRQRVDGLVIWDMNCGTSVRQCPKLSVQPERATLVAHRAAPPPCIYLFPRTIPDPRNNPAPRCWRLDDVEFLSLLHSEFKGDQQDVTEVRLEASIHTASAGPQRVTTLVRAGQTIIASQPSPVKRAK